MRRAATASDARASARSAAPPDRSDAHRMRLPEIERPPPPPPTQATRPPPAWRHGRAGGRRAAARSWTSTRDRRSPTVPAGHRPRRISPAAGGRAELHLDLLPSAFLLVRPDRPCVHLVDHQLRDQPTDVVAGLPRATVRPQLRDRTTAAPRANAPHRARQLRRRARARPRQRQPHAPPDDQHQPEAEMPTRRPDRRSAAAASPSRPAAAGPACRGRPPPVAGPPARRTPARPALRRDPEARASAVTASNFRSTSAATVVFARRAIPHAYTGPHRCRVGTCHPDDVRWTAGNPERGSTVLVAVRPARGVVARHGAGAQQPLSRRAVLGSTGSTYGWHALCRRRQSLG